MSASTRPDLTAFMHAYALLGIEYPADPLAIRKAYRRLAREHHPDRYAAGSTGQQQATNRMVALNKAYELVRDAPLRHHRVSTGADPDRPWQDAELDEALRLARLDRVIAYALAVVLILGTAVFVRWFIPALIGNGTGGALPLAMIPVTFVYLIVARRLTYVRVWKVSAIVGLLTELRPGNRAIG
jgi:DnaJ domain